MALSVSLHHLSYHDSGLQGVSGAMVVLRALSHNPFCSKITLSHNSLRDEGITALCSGILDLRKRGRIMAPLHELNLASNGMTDVGLDAVIRFLLLPSAPPQSQMPTIRELILSNNNISLANTSTAYLLSTALSHPSSTLMSLSLTNNSQIGEQPGALESLLKHLEPTSLVQLQLNTCNLGPEHARIIARWLSEPKQGGRLQHLELNANTLGTDSMGTNRLAKVVYAGLNTSLLRLELSANERQIAVLDEDGDPTGEIRRVSTAKPEKDGDGVLYGDDLPFEQIKPILANALARNNVLRTVTRHAALQLLPVARILSHARSWVPSQAELSKQMDDVVKESSLTTTMANGLQLRTTTRRYGIRTSDSAKTDKHDPLRALTAGAPRNGTCPLLSLPPELIEHILRVFTTLDPVPLPPNPTLARHFDPTQATPPTFASALSERQFMNIFRLARDRGTLRGYTERYDNRQGGSRSNKDSRSTGRISLHTDTAFLNFVDCMEYERRPI